MVDVLGEPLSITETVFSSWNMIAAAVTIVVVAGALALIAPRNPHDVVPLGIDARETDAEIQDQVITPADRVDACWCATPSNSSR